MSSNTQKINLIVNGLNPSKKYQIYLGELNVSNLCLPMSKGSNFQSVYDYYLENWTTGNFDVNGDPIKRESSDLLQKIFFEGFSRSADSTLNTNVVVYGDLGDDLIADNTGTLAFSFYYNENNLDLDQSLKGSGVGVTNQVDVLSKYFIIKDMSGNEIGRMSLRELLKNKINMNRNIKSI